MRLKRSGCLCASRSSADFSRGVVICDFDGVQSIEVERHPVDRITVSRTAGVSATFGREVAGVVDEDLEYQCDVGGICRLDTTSWADFLLFRIPNGEVEI